MTCIAWDGKTLAADRRAVNAGMFYSVQKISRMPDGSLFGCAGDYVHGLEMREWIIEGCQKEHFPERQKDIEKYVVCLIVKPDKNIIVFEDGVYPAEPKECFFAIGSGRNYAMAAMFLGKTAYEAVEIACHFDVNCGNNIDTLTL
jgi:ATP-dependent protease HslVU (ClpYQ) peptidase subunit